MMLLAIILPIFPAIFWHTGICTGKSNGASIRDFGLPEMALIGLACSMIYFIAGFMTHDSAAKTTFGAARVKPICRNSCGQSASHYFQLVALGVLMIYISQLIAWFAARRGRTADHPALSVLIATTVAAALVGLLVAVHVELVGCSLLPISNCVVDILQGTFSWNIHQLAIWLRSVSRAPYGTPGRPVTSKIYTNKREVRCTVEKAPCSS
jgi:hypothetical protein